VKIASLWRRRNRAAMLCVAAFLLVVPCQPQTAHPQTAPLMHFDIYTVKPDKTGGGGMSVSWHDNVFSATNVNLKFLLQIAYNIRQPLLENVPKWGESGRWDVQGKISDFDPVLEKSLTIEQKRSMQRDFLAHAFAIRAHIETRVQPTYEMVVAKTGLKMTENTLDPDSPEAKGKLGSMSMNNGRLDAQGVKMENITKALEGEVERTIVDKTGLTGSYDAHLHWQPEKGAVKPDDEAQPGIFTAIQEQLGLKLQPSKGDVDVLVVDAAQLPEEN
jgi:bla regulator protein BlaR1